MKFNRKRYHKLINVIKDNWVLCFFNNNGPLFFISTNQTSLSMMIKLHDNLRSNQSEITGFSNNGKRSWRINVDEIWGGRSKYLFRSNLIKDGVLFDRNDKPVIIDLQAKNININSSAKSFSAYQDIYGQWLREKNNYSSSKKC